MCSGWASAGCWCSYYPGMISYFLFWGSGGRLESACFTVEGGVDHSLHLWYSHWLRHDERTLLERFSLWLPICDLWVKFVRLWKWSWLRSAARLTWNGALSTECVSTEHRHCWRLFSAIWFVGWCGSCSGRGVHSVALQLDTKTITVPFGIPNIVQYTQHHSRLLRRGLLLLHWSKSTLCVCSFQVLQSAKI